MLRAHTGRPEEGLECQQRAAAMYDTLGDAVGSAGATTNIGILLTNLGRTSEAREWLRLGLERTRTAGHARFEAIALIGTAALHHAVGEPEPAREFAEAGMNLARRIGDRRAEAMAANTLANALGGLDRDAEQWAMQERHVAIAREIGDVREEAIGIGNLGISAKSNGRLREAVGLYESALVLHRQVANPEGESTVLGNLGALLLQMGQIAAARDACERALTLAHRIGTKYPEGFWADLRARIAEEEGDADAAERLFAEAIAVRREIADKEGLVSSLLSRGAFRARAGRREAAILDFEESRSIPLASAAGRDAWSGAWLALLGRRGPVDLAGTATADWDERGLGAAELAYILWQATHDPAHLAEAKRLLDDLVAHAPPEYRESMLTNVRLHREIVAACRGVGL
jgi:tetratricopeptide (TPR) repeat protein